MNHAECTCIAVKWFDGLVLTNPNTLGLFEEHVEEVALIIHGCGGLVYGDGANMNALVGAHRPRSVDDRAN
jgi:glycine cleavage system protein P-like pyridoxal-binding family